MFYSKKYKLLFIAIPKTGTTSIEIFFKKMDPLGEDHSITIGERIYSGKDFKQGILGHARAKEIKEIVGDEFYSGLDTLAFIRNPYSKLVSAYFFNKTRPFSFAKDMKGKKKLLLRQARYILSLAFAKYLPFYLWVFFYPYRSNYSYIFDEKGNRLVKHIGRTEFLAADLKFILEKIGIEPQNIEIEHKNKSSHKDFTIYFKNKVFRYLVSRKIEKDLAFYHTIETEMSRDSK